MDGKFEAVVGSLAVVGASGVSLLPDAQTVEAAARWPVVVILGAVCCFCVWVIYQQGCQFGRRMDKLSDSIKGLTEELRQRPCVRRREND
ncbi:MAG: hypothetical protein WCL16_07090 [bacterium]